MEQFLTLYSIYNIKIGTDPSTLRRIILSAATWLKYLKYINFKETYIT